MGEVRTAIVGVALLGCGFDSGGVAGSGDLQGTSTSDAASSATTSTTGADSGSASDPTLDETTHASMVDPSASDADSSTGTATRGSTSTGDRGDDPPELGPFAAPIELVEIDTEYSDDDPTLTPDLLEIYFASLRPGGEGNEDIWRATRSDPRGTFDAPEVVAALNGPSQDGWPELSHDGLVLTLGSDRAGGEGSFDIYVSVRGSLSEAFPEPTLAADLSTFDSEAAAVMSSTMLEALLCSPISGFADLRFATRGDLGQPFADSVPLASVNSLGRDCTPFLDASGTRLLFGSDRVGTIGSMDIWTAQRDADGDAFAPAENVAELNTIWDDDDPWWAPDGSAVYFSSARGAGSDLDLWVAYLE